MINTRLNSTIKAKASRSVLAGITAAALVFMTANGAVVTGGALMFASGAAMADGNFSSDFKVCKMTQSGIKFLLKTSKNSSPSCKNIFSSVDGEIKYWSYSRNNSKYCHKSGSVCESLPTAELIALSHNDVFEVVSGAIAIK